jgi:hypothetical protein
MLDAQILITGMINDPTRKKKVVWGSAGAEAPSLTAFKFLLQRRCDLSTFRASDVIEIL